MLFERKSDIKCVPFILLDQNNNETVSSRHPYQQAAILRGPSTFGPRCSVVAGFQTPVQKDVTPELSTAILCSKCYKIMPISLSVSWHQMEQDKMNNMPPDCVNTLSLC